MTTKKTAKKTVKDKKENVVKEEEYIPLMLGSEQIKLPGIERTKKKVAIVGFAPSSMTDVRCHFGDPEWEIWPLNQLYMAFPAIVQHATRWFQIHPRAHYDAALRDHNHHEWMSKQRNFPIYMQHKWADVPMSIQYPADFIAAQFRRYFTNSISWMLATAVYETLVDWHHGKDGFDTIAIYGVDMAMGGPGSEYSFERPSVEYFCGIIDGMNVTRIAHKKPGINLIIPQQSDICKTLFLYPFQETAPFREKWQRRRQELRERVNQHAMLETQNHDARMQLIGALEDGNYILQAWESSIRESATVPSEEYIEELKAKVDAKLLE